MSYLEQYELMKQAEAKAEAAEKETKETEKVASEEEMEVIEKYASAADDLLSKEFGEDYDENDVVELATMLINEDAKEAELKSEEEALEKVGAVIAQGFLKALNTEE